MRELQQIGLRFHNGGATVTAKLNGKSYSVHVPMAHVVVDFDRELAAVGAPMIGPSVGADFGAVGLFGAIKKAVRSVGRTAKKAVKRGVRRIRKRAQKAVKHSFGIAKNLARGKYKKAFRHAKRLGTSQVTGGLKDLQAGYRTARDVSANPYLRKGMAAAAAAFPVLQPANMAMQGMHAMHGGGGFPALASQMIPGGGMAQQFGSPMMQQFAAPLAQQFGGQMARQFAPPMAQQYAMPLMSAYSSGMFR